MVPGESAPSQFCCFHVPRRTAGLAAVASSKVCPLLPVLVAPLYVRRKVKKPVPHMAHQISSAPSGRCTVWECTTCVALEEAVWSAERLDLCIAGGQHHEVGVVALGVELVVERLLGGGEELAAAAGVGGTRGVDQCLAHAGLPHAAPWPNGPPPRLRELAAVG